jgi:hypothetical protein
MAGPGVSIRFYMADIKDETASAARGHPIFTQEEWAEIRIAGVDMYNPSVIPVRVTAEIKAEFAEAYAAWQKGEEVPLNGTPLAEWPQIQRREAELLVQNGIRTVEDFAAAREDLAAKFPGGMTLQKKAQAWLAAASSTGRAAEQIAGLTAMVEALHMQIEQMGDAGIAVPAKATRRVKRGRGRPRKVKAVKAVKPAPAAPPVMAPASQAGEAA